MLLNATFNNIQLYRGGQFYWWRKPKDPEKSIPLYVGLTIYMAK